jgi:hypothetical protein
MTTGQLQGFANKPLAQPVGVILKPWQVEWAAYAGKQRTERNAGKVVNTPDYDVNPDSLQPDLDANTASCLCELATSIYTNQRWNGPYWSPKHHAEAKQTPDVGRDIEVRRTRELGRGIPVFEREAEREFRLVQAYISPEELTRVLEWAAADNDEFDFAEIVLTGTVPAAVAWKHGQQLYPDKRVCPARHFSSITSLTYGA